ncbi:response regulator transcription factor [Parablautia muri]|uniref:Stage 0 sporulation protein A homolog n=1 Tax=Parablautia muri TaxID=2320879 RepID=A0A9X5GT52_9FIRM|nr:response regulator transcription factor [Parablautia muri]NBJ93641.1 DNA-binding response regulator [Parablautia muri]
MHRIMIIEDEPAVREELALLLKNEGYHVLPVTDFTDVPQQTANYRPHLILLDIGLPGGDGFSLCVNLRKSADVPIIFVTGKDSGADEVKALSLGGDDYITKPYSVPVLLARIKAVLRRINKAPGADVIEIEGLSLDLAKGTVSRGTKKAVLSRNELQILACLMAYAGEIVSRADLIEMLWDNQIYIDDNTLSVNVTRLRGKLKDIGAADLIKTRRGMGYQL